MLECLPICKDERFQLMRAIIKDDIKSRILEY